MSSIREVLIDPLHDLILWMNSDYLRDGKAVLEQDECRDAPYAELLCKLGGSATHGLLELGGHKVGCHVSVWLVRGSQCAAVRKCVQQERDAVGAS